MRIRLVLGYFLYMLFMSGMVQGQAFKKAFVRMSQQEGKGLAANRVTALVQDTRGYMWVASSNGLQRFDGNRMLHLSDLSAQPMLLPGGEVQQLLPAADGRIWMLFTDPVAIGLFDPIGLQYQPIPLKPTQPIPARAEYKLFADSHGDVLLHILRYPRLLRYDTSLQAFTENTPINQLPAGWMPGLYMTEDTDAQCYWLVTSQGLCQYHIPTRSLRSAQHNPHNHPLLRLPSTARTPSEVFLDRQKRLWYFYWTGTQEFNCYTTEGIPLPDTAGLAGVNHRYAEVRHFFQSRNGTLWLFGPGALYTLDPGQKRFQFLGSRFPEILDIQFEEVYQVFEDRDGVIWVATDQGLYYHIPSRKEVGNIMLSATPGTYEVTDMMQARDGNYWLTTWGQGIQVFDTTYLPTRLPLYNGMPVQQPDATMFKQCWSICQQSEGDIWIGCQAGRLMRYNPVSRTTAFLTPVELSGQTIRYITEDTLGRIWMCTQGGRVAYHHQGSFVAFFDLPQQTPILKMQYDKGRHWVWLATRDYGLYAIHCSNGKVMAHYLHKGSNAGLSGNSIWDFEALNDTMLYVAAGGALHLINTYTKQVEVLGKKGNAPTGGIRRLRLDSKGHVWLISGSGLVHYDHTRKKFTVFGKKEGVYQGEMVYSCDMLDQGDRLIFAGPNTLLTFHPQSIYNAPRPRPAVITDFQLINANLAVDSLLSLPYISLAPDQNTFNIHFSSLSFLHQGRQTYFYQLLGADKDWVKAADNQAAFYRLLPPGKYTFRVRVENIDGLAAEQITTLNIHIRPVFFRTGWFISLVLMLASMMGYGMHRLHVKKALAVEKIRGRVSRDLHDDMGSALSTIHILSNMGSQKLNTEPAKTRDYLQKIGENSQRMMEAMDDIVWAIKPNNDSMQKLVARMREWATQALEAKDVLLDLQVDEDLYDWMPDMETRRDLYLLFKEAINNVVKYAQASKVEVRMNKVHQSLELTIQDNGKGFDPQNADGGNGLGNMQRRAQALKGTYALHTAPGKGTQVFLKFLLNNRS